MNPIIPDVEIELRGTKRKLFFRHKDFALAEWKLKQQGYDLAMIGPQAATFWGDLIAAEEEESGGPVVLTKFNALYAEALLYVGLIRNQPRLKFDELMDQIDFDNMAVLAEVVAAAAVAISRLSPAKPEPKEAEGQPESPLPGANGGAADGPSPAATSESQTEISGT